MGKAKQVDLLSIKEKQNRQKKKQILSRPNQGYDVIDDVTDDDNANDDDIAHE